MNQEEVDAMREAEDALNMLDDEPEEGGDLLGYVCMGCGHSQGHAGLDQCDKCCGPLEKWYA